MAARSSPNDRIADAVLLFAALLFPLVIVLAHRGVAPLAGIFALAIALRVAVWRDGFALFGTVGVRTKPLPQAAFASALLCLWILLGGVLFNASEVMKLSLTVGAAILAAGAFSWEALNASPIRLRRIAIGYAAAVATGAGLLLFEAMTGGFLRAITPPVDDSPGRYYDMTALGRGVTALCAMAFPAAAIIFQLTKSRLAAAMPIIALTIAALRFSIEANVIALAAGAVALLISLRKPALAMRIFGGLFLLGLAIAPAALLLPDSVAFYDHTGFPASWLQRFIIWRTAAAHAFGECFPWGCGADFARAIHNEGRVVSVPGSPIALPVMPIHPHNVFLQVWLELGVPGVILVGVAIFGGMRALGRVNIGEIAIAAISASAAVIFVSFSVEASLWQAWRLAAIAFSVFGATICAALQKHTVR
ncbi:MAG: hypothetical protein R3C60_00625 [Parvularculaceae bacterium]